ATRTENATPDFRARPHAVSSGKDRKGPIQNLLKHVPLLLPIDSADNGPQVSFVEALHVWQKKDLLLDIRSEIEQLHNLGHSGSRHPAEAGELGIVPKLFGPQQTFATDGERHQPGH